MSYACAAKAIAIAGVFVIAKQCAAVSLGEGMKSGVELPTPTASMSSVWADRNPTEGFGGKPGIGGCMRAGGGQWLKLDFGRVVSISKINSVKIFGHESPSKWKVEYSTNGNSWTKAGDWNGDSEKSVSAQARYVKAAVTSSSGTLADCLNLKVSGGGGGGPAPSPFPPGCTSNWHQDEHLGAAQELYHKQNTEYSSQEAATSACMSKDHCNAVMFYKPHRKWYMRNWEKVNSQKWKGTVGDKWCKVK